MAHIHFHADFDYRPSGAPRTVIAYKAGKRYPVKRECADQAIAEGKGREIDAPPREPAPPTASVAITPRRRAKVRHAD